MSKIQNKINQNQNQKTIKHRADSNNNVKHKQDENTKHMVMSTQKCQNHIISVIYIVLNIFIVIFLGITNIS